MRWALTHEQAEGLQATRPAHEGGEAHRSRHTRLEGQGLRRHTGRQARRRQGQGASYGSGHISRHGEDVGLRRLGGRLHQAAPGFSKPAQPPQGSESYLTHAQGKSAFLPSQPCPPLASRSSKGSHHDCGLSSSRDSWQLGVCIHLLITPSFIPKLLPERTEGRSPQSDTTEGQTIIWGTLGKRPSRARLAGELGRQAGDLRLQKSRAHGLFTA